MENKKSVALVHDWIIGIGGDVRVLKALHELFPSAPIYCLFRNKNFTDEFFPDVTIIPGFKFYVSRLKFLLPFSPSAIESINLSEYDLVISTGSIFSKGLILKPKVTHIAYCHSPTRQVWDLSHEAISDFQFIIFEKMFQHFLRLWDRLASTRVDYFIANSENIRARIRKYYQRDSTIIYPPVNLAVHLEVKPLSELRGFTSKFSKFFLIVSRLYKHKNIDIAIRAFNKLGWELVIVGDGPDRKRLERMAAPNVKLVGYLPDDQCSAIYDTCSAFIMPQEEDFGIAPIEAMAHGKPVLALRAGGALEYIKPGINGEFFDDPAEEVLAHGVWQLREHLSSYNPSVIRETVRPFGKEQFKSNMLEFINEHCT